MPQGEKCDRKSAFPTGRCAMVISMPGTLTSFLLPDGKRAPMDRVNEATGDVLWSIQDQPLGPGGDGTTQHWGRRAVFPGSQVVESKDRRELVSCNNEATKKLCPLASRDDGVNFAAFFAEGGEAYALNGRQSKPSARDVMWDVFTWLSELPATQLPLSGQYRKSHLSSEAKEELKEEGWPDQAADDLFDVLGAYFRSEENGGNPVQDLLMLGFREYMGALDEELHSKLLGVKVDSPTGGFFDKTDPSKSLDAEQEAGLFDSAYDDFIDTLEERWIAISRSMSGGVLGQLQRWRQSLGLPWKTDVELCSAALAAGNIEAFKNLGCETVVDFEALCQTQADAVATYDPSLCDQYFGRTNDNSAALIAAILVPIVVLMIAIIFYCIYRIHSKKHGDALWIVKSSELEFQMVPPEVQEPGEPEPLVIGQGSFGVVHLAEYRGTRVAVKKVIPPEIPQKKNASTEMVGPSNAVDTNPGLQSMRTLYKGTVSTSPLKSSRQRKSRYEKLKEDFIVEMRQLAKLRHPNITTIIGAVVHEQEPLLIMEYMENGSLYDAIRNDTIDLNTQEDILTIAQDIAHGLHFLHSSDLLHGDLKCKNILLDSNYRAKLSDFGLSCSSKSLDGTPRGTPYWMGPEILGSEASANTTASDIYAFGIILYELYARKNPYEGEDYDEVIRLVCDPSVSKRPPVPALCPPNVKELSKLCLLHNPQDRPAAKEVDLVLQAEGTIQGRVFRIAALNRDLLETNKQITSEQAAQLRHFSCMSHEIRTPLNCVIGVSSLLEEDETLTSAQLKFIKMIMSSGNLLKKVVDDVLDFNKFVSGNAEIDLKRVDLQETLGNIIESMALNPITERKGISLRTFYDPLVPQYMETDHRRLQQIFYNLLSNAVKFSETGSNIDLRVSVKANKTNASSSTSLPHLEFDIIDYGKGIKKEDFKKIFQPFQQTETGVTNVDGGTGLGLAIVKQLVELLGGTIAVDSKVGEWTKFALDFPLTASLDDTGPIAARLTNCSVWLVSKCDTETQTMMKSCRHYGVDCVHFGSLREAEASLRPSPRKDDSLACFVQEDLYDDSVFKSLSARSKTVLITFGPHGKIGGGQVHYQSLTRIFPSVMMQELGTALEYASITRRTLEPKETIQDSCEGLKVLRVLVADDNIINQKVLGRLVERIGVAEVMIAGDGQEAVDMSSENEYDVIFMDVQMPIMDGLKASKIITSRASAPKVVFCTAHTSDDFESTCVSCGGVAFVSKPCTIGEVRVVLQKIASGLL
uniref:Guanylate cyclase n=2 Tax=Grammatophora oceanica TaxID=210454 RepID=A0A7S1YFW9_9STRA